MKEFKFHLGHGSMFHGAVATMRNQNTIDMAYSFYQLDFQLTAEQSNMCAKKEEIPRDHTHWDKEKGHCGVSSTLSF